MITLNNYAIFLEIDSSGKFKSAVKKWTLEGRIRCNNSNLKGLIKYTASAITRQPMIFFSFQ